MSVLTIVFYVGVAVLLLVMLMGSFMKPRRFSRRFQLTCPTDRAAVTVWATLGQNGDSVQSWRLDGCTRLEPSHTCTEDCLKELRA